MLPFHLENSGISLFQWLPFALHSGTAARNGSGAFNRATIIRRAELGDAAWAAIVKMSSGAKADFAIIYKMTKIVKDSGPFVKKA